MLSVAKMVFGPSGGMADAGDLKSPVLTGVWVRLPSRPLLKSSEFLVFSFELLKLRVWVAERF